MIELKTGKGNLVLDPKTSIRFSYTFPMFVTANIPAQVSYSFDIPNDPKGINSAIIGSSPFFDVKRTIRKVSVNIIFHGIEIESGELICRGYSGGKFRCMLFTSAFADGFSELELQQIAGLLTPIELGETPQEVADNCKLRNSQSYPETDVVFPTIHAPEFYGDTNEDFNGFMNIPNDEDGNFTINEIVKAWHSGDPVEGIYETNRFSFLPAFYARSIIREIFKSQGYRVKGGFFSNQASRNAVILGLKAADRSVKESYLNANITGYVDVNSRRRLTSNDYKIGTSFTYDGEIIHLTQKGYYEITISELLLNVNNGALLEFFHLYIKNITNDTILKEISIPSLLLEAKPDTKLELSAYFWFSGNSPIDIIIAGYCDDGGSFTPVSGKIDVNGESQNFLNLYAQSINIGESFSGISVSKMVDTIQMLFGVLIFPDKIRNTIQLEMASDIIANHNALDITSWIDGEPQKEFEDQKKYVLAYDWNDTETMTPIYPKEVTEYATPFGIPDPIANLVVKVKNMFRYLKTEYIDTGEYVWTEIATFIENLNVGTGSEEDYKPEIQSLIQHVDFEKKIIAPHLSGEGRSDVYGIDNEMKLTVLNYLGIIESETMPYPMASVGNVDINNVAVRNVDSLRFDGTDGMYAKTLKPMFDILNNHDTVTVDIFLTIERLQKLLRIFQSTIDGEPEPPRLVKIDGVEIWIKSFDFQVSNKGIEAAQLKLALKRNE